MGVSRFTDFNLFQFYAKGYTGKFQKEKGNLCINY